MASPLLILLDDSLFVDQLVPALQGVGGEVIIAKDRNDALFKAEKASPAAFLGQRLATFEEDLAFVEKFRALQPKIPLYLCGERFKLTETIRAVRTGIRGVIEPPYSVDDVLAKLGSILHLEYAETAQEAPMKSSNPSPFPGKLSTSRPGRVLRISPGGGGPAIPRSAGAGDLADRLREVEKERDNLRREVTKLSGLKDREEEIRKEFNRLESERENLETERILLAQARKKLADEQARMEQGAAGGASAQAAEQQLSEEAQAEIEDLYVQVAELKGRLKKAEAGGGDAMSAAERQQLEELKKDLEDREEAVREAKAFIREREIYLDECENTIMEKSMALDTKEAEIDQLREELREERKKFAARPVVDAEALDGQAIAWQTERAELLDRIGTLENSMREQGRKATADAEAQEDSYTDSLNDLENRLAEEVKNRSALEAELNDLRESFAAMKEVHDRLALQRKKLLRNLEGLRELAAQGK